METIKIFEKIENLNWVYDEEADVLYISIGKPQKAVGIDIGDGVIVRINEDDKETVGLTILGIKERIIKATSKNFLSV